MNTWLEAVRQWGLCAVALWIFCACETSPLPQTNTRSFDLKLLSWTDGSGEMSAAILKQKIETNVVNRLPALKNGSVPMLFVRGSLRADGKGSVMILEGRFLFSHANVPVKIIVMGSVEGETATKREHLIQGMLGDLREGLRANIAICNGNVSTWMTALQSPEADEQILALKLLRINGEKKAASKVISLLDDPRSEVANAAVETAFALADRTHVKEIIHIAQKGGVEVEARCVEVLSRIGGPEAVAFLEMFAVGHENQHMRELSFNALKRLK